MSFNESILRKSLLCVIFLTLFLPLIQSNFRLFKVKDLKGYFVPALDIDFDKKQWLTGEYQAVKEKYINDNFGLRNTVFRLLNQINFFFFQSTSSAEAVIGRENYLYAKAYIESYNGENYIGNNLVLKKSLLVKELQEKLAVQGKVFLPVLAPNKARVLNEYLPESNSKRSFSNYEAFKLCFDKLSVKYIDFESHFIKNYNKSKYPLYSKYGIHWSTYGHCFATDSIISYLNSFCNLNTNKLIWKDNIILSDSLRDLDYDIAEGMNLFVDQMPSQKMAYPKLSYTQHVASKPTLLVVGDSFYYGIEKTDMQNQVFSGSKFLYYNKELDPYSGKPNEYSKLNIKDEINNHQVFMLICTEHNLIDYGWGFIEKAVAILDGRDNGVIDDKEKKIQDMMTSIYNDEKWIITLKNDAVLQNKKIEDLVRENAIYMVKLKEEELKKVRDDKITGMKKIIKADEKWIKILEKKSKEQGIEIDSLILLDAIYIVDLDKNK